MESKTSASNSGLQELTMYKNRLQEVAQKSGMPLPEYRSVNEGTPNVPKFTATVVVDGVTFTSPNTFLNKKAAEQGVAKIALESVLRKVECEGASMIEKGILFCKSILYEYAIKMKLAVPTYKYKVSIQKGAPPIFSATSIFNGQSFVGDTAKSKKEAEQLAARAVILSLLANPDTKTVMSQIIKSKEKLFSLYSNMGNSSNLYNTNALVSQMQDNFNDDNGKTETFAREISSQEFTCEPTGETNRNGCSQSALPQGALVTGTTSGPFISSSGSPAQNTQGNDEVRKIGSSVKLENSSDNFNGLRKQSDELESEQGETKKPRMMA